MIDSFLLSQILIGIGFLFAVASFQFKAREHILTCFCCMMCLITVHYFILNQITAAWLHFFATLRIFVAIFTTDKRFPLFFATIVVAAFILTYAKPVDFIVLISSLIFTLSSFQKTDKKLRQLDFMGANLALIYNLIIFSPAMVMLEFFIIASNIIGYYRHYIKEKI